MAGRRIAAAMAAAAVVLAGCSSPDGVRTGDDPAGAEAAPEPQARRPAPTPGPDRSADRSSDHPGGGAPAGSLRGRVQQLTLRSLVHQLLVVTVAGTRPRAVTSAEADRNLADFGVRTPAAVARTFQPGGVVYFDANVDTVGQVAALSRGLHRAGRRAGSPPLLFTDQEGGPVSRLPGPVAQRQPAARDLGGDRVLGAASARRVGAAMAAMGLDVDFAPVADVDTVGGSGVIGDRAFGTTGSVVGRMVRAQTCGYHRDGVAVTLKHWPGHGSTTTDSHQSLPTLTVGVPAWRRTHLPPFVAGIAGGADLVMTGHLAYPRLDASGRPATLSRRLTTGWLRGRLGFDGVVVTDALEMGALTDFGSPGQIAVRALRAGADLLLMSPAPRAAARAVRAAVRDGRLTRRGLEASALRVLRLKDATGLVRGPGELTGC